MLHECVHLKWKCAWDFGAWELPFIYWSNKKYHIIYFIYFFCKVQYSYEYISHAFMDFIFIKFSLNTNLIQEIWFKWGKNDMWSFYISKNLLYFI